MTDSVREKGSSKNGCWEIHKRSLKRTGTNTRLKSATSEGGEDSKKKVRRLGRIARSLSHIHKTTSGPLRGGKARAVGTVVKMLKMEELHAS